MRVKKLVYMDEEQGKRVKMLAREAKISETELIRRAIDAYGSDESAKVAAAQRRVMEYVKAHPEGWDDDPAEWFHG
jgi:hypothetical protein